MVPIINIPAKEMVGEFYRVLINHGFEDEKALSCAEIFTGNSVDGVYTHGVNRFARFVQNCDDGYIKPAAVPSLKNKFAGIEQWDGNLGPGPLNAMHATGSAMDLSEQHGIGCVALANTNHWMRGGTYGWHAAKKGFVFIAWTNTIANMPAWGATDARLGNNPLVMALPFEDEAIVLDMAMSQYSFGALELANMKNETLPVYGGYDKSGRLTNDPGAIIESRRPLPVGFWKGAGLSLLLDILAAVLSEGLSTAGVSKKNVEYGMSQVFIVIDIKRLRNFSAISALVKNIIDDYHQSVAEDGKTAITYPGERVLQTRKKNLANGVPVLQSIWDVVTRL